MSVRKRTCHLQKQVRPTGGQCRCEASSVHLQNKPLTKHQVKVEAQLQ